MRIKDIAMIGMMSALLFAVQVALGFLPNIELVSLLIILFTLNFRWKTLYIIYIFALLEGFMYGFGIWWFYYLYIWTILFFITLFFSKNRSSFFWAVVSGVFGICFGALCAISYLFLGGLQTAIGYWVSGIPFDIAHGIGNFVIALVLFRPLNNLLDFIINRTFHSNSN